LLATICAAILAGCTTQPRASNRDPAQQPGYARDIEQLASINREANAAFAGGKADQAAELIKKGEPISARLLAVDHPTEAALQAASDLDDLYGRMLFSNRHYAWARMFFQKNLVRWKHWNPPTEESARRLRKAQDQIADCDRLMGQ